MWLRVSLLMGFVPAVSVPGGDELRHYIRAISQRLALSLPALTTPLETRLPGALSPYQVTHNAATRHAAAEGQNDID